jgi:hypothetical protein
MVNTASDESGDAGGQASAPSSVSQPQNEFINASYTLGQFDCVSDCTESTGGEFGMNPLGTGVGFTRRRLRSGDTAYSEVSNGDAWDNNSSLFHTTSAVGTQSQSYFLPSPTLSPILPQVRPAPTEGGVNQSSSSSAPTISNMVLSQSYDLAQGVESSAGPERSYTAVENSWAGLHAALTPLSGVSEECASEGQRDDLVGVSMHSAIVSRAPPAALASAAMRRSPSPGRSGRAGTALSKENLANEEMEQVSDKLGAADAEARSLGEGQQEPDEPQVVEVLVLPTLLPPSVQAMLVTALGELGAEVRRENR